MKSARASQPLSSRRSFVLGATAEIRLLRENVIRATRWKTLARSQQRVSLLPQTQTDEASPTEVKGTAASQQGEPSPSPRILLPAVGVFLPLHSRRARTIRRRSFSSSFQTSLRPFCSSERRMSHPGDGRLPPLLRPAGTTYLWVL